MDLDGGNPKIMTDSAAGYLEMAHFCLPLLPSWNYPLLSFAVKDGERNILSKVNDHYDTQLDFS
jgi:hypothetical protein